MYYGGAVRQLLEVVREEIAPAASGSKSSTSTPLDVGKNLLGKSARPGSAQSSSTASTGLGSSSAASSSSSAASSPVEKDITRVPSPLTSIISKSPDDDDDEIAAEVSAEDALLSAFARKFGGSKQSGGSRSTRNRTMNFANKKLGTIPEAGNDCWN